MTSPKPVPKQRSVLPLFVAALLGLSIVALALVAVLPARPPSPELTQLLVMHDSLITGRAHVTQSTLVRASEAPILETMVTGILEGRKVESWLYQLERDLFTVHRLRNTTIVPRNASKLPLGARRVAFFELENLQVLAWEPDDGELVVLLGSGSLPTLLRLGRWIDANGLSSAVPSLDDQARLPNPPPG